MGSHDLPGIHAQDSVSVLQTLLLTSPNVANLLTKVSKLAADLVVPAASVGMTSRYDGHPVTIATSDQRAALIDEEQYTAGDGPCLTAMRTGEFVAVADQDVDDRWPAYRENAVKLGVRCSLSYPLIVGSKSVGAMNVYGFDRPRGFSDDDKKRAGDFATEAAAALELSVRFAKQVELSKQMEQALVSRSVIDQAIGVLMSQQHCDADTAFHLLRTHSQNTNRKLRDVAAEIITRLSGHAPTDGRGFKRADTTDSLSELS